MDILTLVGLVAGVLVVILAMVVRKEGILGLENHPTSNAPNVTR